MFDYWDSLYEDDHAWTFDAWAADVVVINLGQNDRFNGVGDEIVHAYLDFMALIRDTHPEAVDRSGDGRAHAVIFPFNGSGNHPTASEHEEMADVLIDAIRDAMPQLRAP